MMDEDLGDNSLIRNSGNSADFCEHELTGKFTNESCESIGKLNSKSFVDNDEISETNVKSTVDKLCEDETLDENTNESIRDSSRASTKLQAKNSVDDTSKEASSNCEIKCMISNLDQNDQVENSANKLNSTLHQSNKTKKNENSILIVHLLNGGKFECPVTSKSTGNDVFRSTCDYLILREHQYFGLTYRDSHNTRIWINLNKKIDKIIKDNRNSLHFEVKFFPEPTDLKENITRFFLCLQIRNNIIEEKITCAENTYAMLGSYLVQSEFGNYDPIKHSDDYLNDFKFAPKPTPQLIERLKELHKERRGLTASEAELLFLQNAKKLSIYGLDFYPAKDSSETHITIGVCSSGLSVYNKDSECIQKYPWLKISKIAYTPENFFIKVKSNENEGDLTKTENTINFKLCSKKATHALYKITIDHHTFFKTLSSNSQVINNKHSSSKKKRESRSSKHKKEEKISKHHKSDKTKNRKENHTKSSDKREKNHRKTEKSEKKHQKEERHRFDTTVKETLKDRDYHETGDKHLKESTKDNYPDESHLTNSRRKRKKVSDKLYTRDEDKKQRELNRSTIRESHKESHRESNRELNRELHRESHRETHRESHKEPNREYQRESYRELHREQHRETHRETVKESHRDLNHSSRAGKESRKEERRREYDRDHKYRERHDRSNERKRHKRKHSKHSKHEPSTSDKKKPISIAESHYQSLANESMKYLNEKIKSKESEHKNKRQKRSDHENNKSSPLKEKDDNQPSAPQQEDIKKVSNHFIKDIINLDNELMKNQSNSSADAQHENDSDKKAESIKESVVTSKPGSPPKKDVKLSSKSNVEFDIFWDNEKSVDSPAKEMNQSQNKSKDDLNSTNESGEKRFIPRVLLNGSNEPQTNSQPARVFTKFEIKSSRVGPKTPPDDHFNMFETNTLSNQSIPTPTQDESQNEKFNPTSLAGDSSNANSVRSLSPRSMQSDNSHQLAHNNQKQQANNHSTKAINSSGKFEIYDPEAPLESPEQQTSGNVYKTQSTQQNSFKNNINIYNSSTSNNNSNNNLKTNGDHSFGDMEIDSPFSPSKPINMINSPSQQQPKPSTSNISTQQPPQQITGSELKLVLDHLIKTAQLQQKKAHPSNSPFKKSSTVENQQAVDPYRQANLINNFNSADDDLPSSAVELNSREKYIKKLNRQERVVDEMKCCLKPYYQRKEITKEEYKDIMRKAVPKICHSKTGEINPTKIRKLVEVYIGRIKRDRKRQAV